MEKRPSKEQLATFKKNANDPSISAEIRAKFQAIVDKFENVGEEVVDAVEGKKERKPRTPKASTERKPRATKQTGDDIEKAKAEIKARTGKTEEECEKIVEEYRALRTKSQERKKKEAEASKTNVARINKLKKDDKVIEGTNEKTADAVIETTTKDVAEKIEKQIEAVEEKAETEAKKEVEKEMPKVSATEKKKAVKEKVEEKVKDKTKTIVKRVVIDTSALLTTIAESLGKFDKDSQKEFLIKLRSDIDKLLAKYSYGGMTSGATQGYNITQSNLSSSSVNMFSDGGGVEGKRKFYTYVWKSKSAVLNDDYEINKDEDMSKDEIIKYYEERIRRGYDFAVQIYDSKTNKQIYRSKTYDITWDEYDDDNQYAQGSGVGKYDYDYEDIGQFSVADSEWKNYSQEDFRRMGKKIVKEKYNGDLTRAYNSVVRKNKMETGGGVEGRKRILYKVVGYFKANDYDDKINGHIIADDYITRREAENTMMDWKRKKTYPYVEIEEYMGKDPYKMTNGGGIKDVIVYDNGGESFDRYTIFTPDGSVYGMSYDASGFNQYLGDDTEVEKGSHLGKKLKSVPKSIEKAVMQRMNDSYSVGGGVDSMSKEDALKKAMEMGVDFDKDFHAQSYGNELSELAKKVGYKKSPSSSGSLGRAFFYHLQKIYDKKKYSNGGGVYNRSWHQDHYRHNKRENYEIPMGKRKKYERGGTMFDAINERRGTI